jgi:DNA-binding NtrC family response regulator
MPTKSTGDFASLVRRFARVRDPLLLLGPPGVGKSTVARAIHQASGRRGEFVRVSVASLPDELAYGLLAGHAKGAFTGADVTTTGHIQNAHQGTLFLDEIGDASAVVQTLLLDVIESQAMRRLGDARSYEVDVRVIAATNRDLREGGETGFRRDLRDRFGYFVLPVPSLADRREDILPLASTFLVEVGRDLNLAEIPRLAPDVASAFLEAPWPGNIRDLRSACRYAAVKADPETLITLAHLPDDFCRACVDARGAALSPDKLEATLRLTSGNKSAAARMLRVSRTTLHKHLQQ